MKSGQRVMRVLAVCAIALAAGHVAQSGQRNTVHAASMGPVALPLAAKDPHSTAAPDPVLQSPALIEASLPVLPMPTLRPATSLAAPLAPPEGAAALVTTSAPDCVPMLALAARPGATIDILLAGTCRPNERVVLRHAGLAVTYRTNEAGALFASIPAFQPDAAVSIRFAGGVRVDASLFVPEAEGYRRFGVQWLGPQAFRVNAFENGADYGDAGHVSATSPRSPHPGGGFLIQLGDASVETPMLAEIYTFPRSAAPVSVLVEAAVTETTCGQDMLGDLMMADRGALTLSDLSVTMPGCDATGDYLVLKNLLPDLKLASAN